MYKKLIILLILICTILIVYAQEEETGFVITSYDYIYENLSYTIGYYNKTCTPVLAKDAKNASHKEDCTTIAYKTKYYDGKKLGVKIADDEILNPSVYINNQKGVLSEWTIPIGIRNFEDPELGQGCRDYEIEKGVCFETKL